MRGGILEQEGSRKGAGEWRKWDIEGRKMDGEGRNGGYRREKGKGEGRKGGGGREEALHRLHPSCKRTGDNFLAKKFRLRSSFTTLLFTDKIKKNKTKKNKIEQNRVK